MKSKLLILALLPLLFAGCNDLFDEGDANKVYDGPTVVGFFPLEREVSHAQGTTSIEVQLIGPQRDSNLSVNFSVDGESTAVAGTHYNLVSSSPVTLEAGTSTVNIQIQLIEDGVPEGEEVRLTLNLDGASDGVEASENLKTSNIFIRG